MPCGHQGLNLTRLPIPPHRHKKVKMNTRVNFILITIFESHYLYILYWLVAVIAYTN